MLMLKYKMRYYIVASIVSLLLASWDFMEKYSAYLVLIGLVCIAVVCLQAGINMMRSNKVKLDD